MYSESTALVKLLLTKCSVKVNTNAVCGNSTLLTLAIQEENLPLVKLLLKAGADPNFKAPTNYGPGGYPINSAILRANVNFCVVLLQHGCDPKHVNARDLEGAIYRNRMKHLKLLEQYGVEMLSHQNKILDQVLYPNNACDLEYWLHYAYNRLGDNIQCWSDHFVKLALSRRLEACVMALLRWGMYTCPQSQNHPPIWSQSVFYEAAWARQVKCLKLLVELNPWCLQESWLVDRALPYHLEQMPDLTAELMAARKLPPRLLILCRAMIFKHLGYNPIAKAEKLPLPKKLKNFIQFKHVKGFSS